MTTVLDHVDWARPGRTAGVCYKHREYLVNNKCPACEIEALNKQEADRENEEDDSA